MSLLRETIRKLIQEEACETLNDKIYDALEYAMEEGMALEYGLYPDFVTVRLIQPLNDNELIGFVEGTKDVQAHGGKCHDAYVIGMARIYNPRHKDVGLGALLYDIALELVGDDGLAADRFSVSDDAIRNWRYFHRSSDYIKKPLDNKQGSYTEDTIDDCDGESHKEHDPMIPVDPKTGIPTKEEYQYHPLNNVYIKKDKSKPTLECMEANDMIWKVH